MTGKTPEEQRINSILDSLDGIQRAAAPSHLYTRVSARLSTTGKWWSRPAEFLSRPMVAFTLALLLVLVNGWIIFKENATTAEEKTEPLTALAQEYNFDQSSLADANTITP